MKAEIPESDIQAFVDDQLEPSRSQEVLEYLHEHPEEMRRVREYCAHKNAVVRALRSADQVGWDGTDLLAEQLAHRLGRRRTWLRYRTRLAGLAAAVLFLALGWGAHVAVERLGEAAVPEVVESAALAHEIFAEDLVRPVELPASAAGEMTNWFSAHLGERIKIPDLKDVGLRLIGGRLLSSETGPLVQLLYEDGKKRRLTLYLSTQQESEDDPLEVVRLDDVNAGYWQEDDMLYAVVAKAATEQIQLIAAELGAPAVHRKL
jgi:anti-sigma factor RsiW